MYGVKRDNMKDHKFYTFTKVLPPLTHTKGFTNTFPVLTSFRYFKEKICFYKRFDVPPSMCGQEKMKRVGNGTGRK